MTPIGRPVLRVARGRSTAGLRGVSSVPVFLGDPTDRRPIFPLRDRVPAGPESRAHVNRLLPGTRGVSGHRAGAAVRGGLRADGWTPATRRPPPQARGFGERTATTVVTPPTSAPRTRDDGRLAMDLRGPVSEGR